MLLKVKNDFTHNKSIWKWNESGIVTEFFKIPSTSCFSIPLRDHWMYDVFPHLDKFNKKLNLTCFS